LGVMPGRSAGGVLITASFTALQSGTSAINLTNVLLLDSSLAGIGSTTASGSVNVSGVPESSTLLLAAGGLILSAESRLKGKVT